QELRLDVAVDEEMAADLLHQRKSGAREGDVELHLEGGRGQHHATDSRCVVVNPRCNQHRADTLGDDGDIFDREPMLTCDVIDERLHVLNRRGETWAETARSGGEPMSARVPGEGVELRHIE